MSTERILATIQQHEWSALVQASNHPQQTRRGCWFATWPPHQLRSNNCTILQFLTWSQLAGFRRQCVASVGFSQFYIILHNSPFSLSGSSAEESPVQLVDFELGTITSDQAIWHLENICIKICVAVKVAMMMMMMNLLFNLQRVKHHIKH
jgi:hypothetical protein